MTEIKNIKKIITHGGLFHADEVCCVAILRILGCEVPVERIFKAPEEKEEGTIVIDLLNGDFDHHMAKDMCPAYEDGTHYASLGLLCKDLGLCEEYGEDFANLVKSIDNADNGEGNRPYISEAISSLNPIWAEDGSAKSRDAAFEKAVELAKILLERVIISSKAKKEGTKIVEEALKESSDTVVILPKYVPWEHIITAETGKKVVVFKGARGDWNARLVPIDPTSFETIVHFPQEWWGAPAEKLPEGITFCHATGFLLAGETKEAVLKAAYMAK